MAFKDVAAGIRGALLWRGIISAETRDRRFISFAALLLVSSSITFLQLGFIGIDIADAVSGNAITLLAPLSALALLLGPLWACAGGLISGLVLWVHSGVQPLDLFEYYCVSLLNSAALLAGTGLLMGLLFAVALKNKPRGPKRYLYLCIACVISSLVASYLFTALSPVNTNIEQIDQRSPALSIQALIAIDRIGSLTVQTVFNSLLTISSVLVTNFFVWQYTRAQGNSSVRVSVGMRLLVGMACVFLIVESTAFSVITAQSEQEARSSLQKDISFISQQLLRRDSLLKDLNLAADAQSAIAQDGRPKLADLSFDAIIDPYRSPGDGLAIIFSGSVILDTNNPGFDDIHFISDIVGSSVDTRSFDTMAESQELARMLYSTQPIGELVTSKNTERVELGYMMVGKASSYHILVARPASVVFAGRSKTTLWTGIIVAALLVFMLALISRLLRMYLIDPIDTANSSLSKITGGDLDEVVRVRGNTEFASLSDGINATVASLKEYAAESERRIEKDLATAKAIQESALPRRFPPFPDIDAFDIYASMDAAKEVGGDFYDFFLVDDETLCFLIADVSGKGIPGALFMMAAKSELQNHIASGVDLADAISQANSALCANNDTEMFLTAWIATLKFETGELSYVNAGHNPPLLRHGSTGAWEWLTEKSGMFLGVFDGAPYRTISLKLESHDALLLYTDGVNEAFSAAGEQYGDERLEAFAKAHTADAPQELVEKLRADVAEWSRGAEQSDDITMIALEYRG